ncbi:MAG: DUF6502 family protein [Myxococcales bacterium]|nr:hypothetical protein [Myxococcales bacterium]HIK86744.1 hypothetical protein [Myxococcales bacterium]
MPVEQKSAATIGPATSAAVLRAARVLLRPLVRLLLESQITYPVFGDLLKEIMIDVAESDLSITNRRQSDSRISLVTGIHRKDVKRLRRERVQAKPPVPSAIPLGALLVSRWTGDPRFLTAEGSPLPLPRMPSPDGGPSFEELVTRVNKDIPARSVLDEWIRQSIAESDEEGVVRLRMGSFVPEEGLEAKIHFFGRNLRDHVASGAHNLLGEGSPFFDRTVFYDRLSKESADELDRAARKAGATMLRNINRRAFALQEQDEGRENTTYRATVGAYFYGGNEQNEADSSPDEPTKSKGELDGE